MEIGKSYCYLFFFMEKLIGESSIHIIFPEMNKLENNKPNSCQSYDILGQVITISLHMSGAIDSHVL